MLLVAKEMSSDMSSSNSCFGQPLQPSQHPVTTMAVLALLLSSAASAYYKDEMREALVLIWNHTFMTQFYVW